MHSPGLRLEKIGKPHVRAWSEQLAKLPIKASESREFRGMTFPQIIKHNETARKRTISRPSINSYLNGLSAFLDWLADGDELPRNPVDGMRLKVDKAANSPLPFTPGELATLFHSPIFTGYREVAEHKAGPMRCDDWRKWLPLVGLYSGARLSEIGQLLVDDIRQEGGHWLIHITDAGGHGKSLKTTTSKRIVPVHPELAAVGFLAYVERMRSSGQPRLFPDLNHDSREQLGGKPSRWFSRYFTRIGIKEGRTRNFHGLRHGFADALRRAGYLDHQIGILLGHVGTASTMTRSYGVLSQGDLKLRVEMLGRISFPETYHLIAK